MKLATLFPRTTQLKAMRLRDSRGTGDGTMRAANHADPDAYERFVMINDLRTDLKAPKMKVVVGALGICGFSNRTKWPARAEVVLNTVRLSATS